MPNVCLKPVYLFGPYRIDVVKRQLSLNDKQVTVTAKAFDILLTLVQNAGEVVTKDELIGAVWADTIVEENNLTQQISALRKILDRTFIVTVPGRGYCFAAPVRELNVEPTSEFLLSGSNRSTIAIDISSTGLTRFVRSCSFDRGSLVGTGIAAVYVAVVCIAVFFSGGRYTGVAGTRQQSVGILSFKSLDTDDGRLGDGIRDTLRAKLGSIEDITVRPGVPDSRELDALALGRQMNVDVVLAGSVQRDRERVRVAIEMIDIRNERIVWGKTFDDTVSNIFELQDSIAEEVTEMLRKPRLTGTAIEPGRPLGNGGVLVAIRSNRAAVSRSRIAGITRLGMTSAWMTREYS